MDDAAFDLTPTADEAVYVWEPPEPSFDEVLRGRYDELLRDKRHELERPCLTWDEGHCGCFRHGRQDTCPTWRDGCRCDIGHSTQDGCPRWASGCCCDHQPTPDIAERACNNHFDTHTGPAHNSKEGLPWCPAHQKACPDGPHPFVTWEQFRRRFAPAEEAA